MLTETEIARLSALGQTVADRAANLTALLLMPAEENATGDLAELDFLEWSSVVTNDETQLAFALMEVQGVVESIARRLNAAKLGAYSGDSQSPYPFSTALSG